MAETKVNSTLTTLFKQAQTVITFVYLITVGVGMLYYHQKYSEFGINIFQYADIFYFLIAPFEDSFILMLCVIAVLLFSFTFWFDRFCEKNYPRVHSAINFGMTKKTWFRPSQKYSWPITFILLIFIYSDIYGESARDKVLESEPVKITFDNGQSSSGQMIGKTDNTLFLLVAKRVKVIPLNSVVQEIDIGTFVAPEPEPEPKPASPAAKE